MYPVSQTSCGTQSPVAILGPMSMFLRGILGLLAMASMRSANSLKYCSGPQVGGRRSWLVAARQHRENTRREAKCRPCVKIRLIACLEANEAVPYNFLTEFCNLQAPVCVVEGNTWNAYLGFDYLELSTFIYRDTS